MESFEIRRVDDAKTIIMRRGDVAKDRKFGVSTTSQAMVGWDKMHYTLVDETLPQRRTLNAVPRKRPGHTLRNTWVVPQIARSLL